MGMKNKPNTETETSSILDQEAKPILIQKIKTKFELEINETPEAGKFRTILPQILAVTVKNMLLFDLGLSVAFPTIVIPALRGTIDEYSNETLKFTDVEASWFGSIAFICQPLGSLFSGMLTDPLGRKKAMIFVNIPFVLAWLLFYFANSLQMMYIGAVSFGLAVGFMEAPIVTYVGEICQPSIRGTLMTFTNISVTLGVFVIYSLGVFSTWRTIALICLIVPFFTIIALLFVPETPMWLLSRNRPDEALKSLQWLRGWVPAKAVQKEFNELKKYSRNSNNCVECQTDQNECNHSAPSFNQKFKDLTKKKFLKPFILVMVLFALGQFSGCLSMRPFMVQIFKAYKVPLKPSVATVYVGFIGLLGNFTCMLTVRLLGKRRVCIISLFGSVVCCILLATYAQIYFPANYNSFEMKNSADIESNIFPLLIYYALCFWTYGGVAPAAWLYLSEVFPFKSRGIATGLCAALNYILGFISTKTYMNLDKGLSLNGTMWFYTSINLIGLLFAYFMVPETENLTLEDIEKHFSDNSKKLWDIQINNRKKKLIVES